MLHCVIVAAGAVAYETFSGQISEISDLALSHRLKIRHPIQEACLPILLKFRPTFDEFIQEVGILL